MAVTSFAKRKPRGFTLLELLIVIAVIALGTAGVALAMRDTGQTVLEREAVRLAALLDAARGQSYISGSVVVWEATVDERGTPVMRWRGLRGKEPLPTAWLNSQIRVLNTAPVVLGPDPVIAPVRLRLQWGNDALHVVTDGVGAFQVVQRQ